MVVSMVITGETMTMMETLIMSKADLIIIIGDT